MLSNDIMINKFNEFSTCPAPFAPLGELLRVPTVAEDPHQPFPRNLSLRKHIHCSTQQSSLQHSHRRHNTASVSHLTLWGASCCHLENLRGKKKSVVESLVWFKIALFSGGFPPPSPGQRGKASPATALVHLLPAHNKSNTWKHQAQAGKT